ncbi:MAG: hypothetical protein LBE57_00475 [Methanosarcinales archaeon]|jgi:G3E family GTPase|nr:hypothetical protein [Methanosarcinales archaeon]
MKVFQIGGFLGSGKTTTIIKLIDRLAADGKKIALILNEVGEIGIDDATLKKAGISSKELTNGCICCTLAANLRLTVSEIVKNRNPDILIIEPPGLALSNQVRDELLAIDVAMSFAPIVMLVDASKFTPGLSHIPNFTDHQYSQTEIVGINKIDLVDEKKIESIEAYFKEMNLDVYIIRMSAANDEAVIDKIYEMLTRTGEEIVSKIDMQSGLRPKVTPETNSIEISNVTKYLEIYSVSGELTVKSAGTLLENIVSAIGLEISKINSFFVGRIEMGIKVDDTFIKVSQTADINGRKTETEYITREESVKGNYELCFLAAVTNVQKEKIAEIVDQTVGIFLMSKKLTFEKQIQKEDSKILIEP